MVSHFSKNSYRIRMSNKHALSLLCCGFTCGGHEKRIVSVVPREQKKRAVKKDKRGTEREKRVRCPEKPRKL